MTEITINRNPHMSTPIGEVIERDYGSPSRLEITALRMWGNALETAREAARSIKEHPGRALAYTTTGVVLNVLLASCGASVNVEKSAGAQAVPPSGGTPSGPVIESSPTSIPLPTATLNPTETATPFPISLFHPDRAIIIQTKDYKIDYSLSGYDVNQTTAGFKSVLEATGKIESTDAITIYAGQFRVNDQKGQDEVRDIAKNLAALQKVTGQRVDAYRVQTTRATEGGMQANIIATLEDGSEYEAISYINGDGEKVNTWRTEVVNGKTTIFDPKSGKFIDATYGEGGVIVQVTKKPVVITATSTPVPPTATPKPPEATKTPVPEKIPEALADILNIEYKEEYKTANGTYSIEASKGLGFKAGLVDKSTEPALKDFLDTIGQNMFRVPEGEEHQGDIHLIAKNYGKDMNLSEGFYLKDPPKTIRLIMAPFDKANYPKWRQQIRESDYFFETLIYDPIHDELIILYNLSAQTRNLALAQKPPGNYVKIMVARAPSLVSNLKFETGQLPYNGPTSAPGTEGLGILQ